MVNREPRTADRGRPAMVLCFDDGLRLPPPWFVPVEAPACGAVLEVPAEATTDGIARRFECDRLSGHTEGTAGTLGDRHRAVTDNTEGHTMEWDAS